MKTYRHKETGKTVQARQLTEPVTVSLAAGEQTFNPGDYEVVMYGNTHMVKQHEFEGLFEPQEPEAA